MHTYLVLHPSHKVDYFRQADWTDEWCKTAVGIVQAEFERAYAGIDSEDSGDSQPICVSFFFSLFLFMSFQEASEMVSDNIFDSLPVLSAPKKAKLADELTRYLTEPTEVAPDPLLWWIERRAIYPYLSRMALDYLCIPGTTQLILIF